MANRLLSKSRYRKLARYTHIPTTRTIPLLDYPRELWGPFELRARELGITLDEFLEREKRIDQVIAAQLASLDPAVAASGGQSKKPSPARIERIFSRLKEY